MIFDVLNKDENKTGIYCITSLIDNKKYIGQTTDSFYSRYLRHSNLLKNHTHFNAHMQNAYNKYGSDNFVMTVVEICENPDMIALLEEKYIAEYRAKYDCYNFLSGGPTMKGENNPFFGKKHSKETIEKLSALMIGKRTGKENNFYGVNHSGENNGFYGKHHTEESRKKMSEAKSKMYKGSNNPFYGKHHSEETKEKLKNNGLNAQHKAVVCIETGITYRSISEAARQTNSNGRRISDVCRGVRHMTNGLHWKYA